MLIASLLSALISFIHNQIRVTILRELLVIFQTKLVNKILLKLRQIHYFATCRVNFASGQAIISEQFSQKLCICQGN